MAKSRCRGVLGVVLFVVASGQLGTAAGRQDPQPHQPNVVLILIDDLGWGDLGCYGNQFHQTPHIDRLAEQGVRFTDAYAAAPVCSPTRAAIMTGKYPARLYITDFIPGHWRPWAKLTVPAIRHELPLEEVTLAELAKQAGYYTGYFGKWHLGGRAFFPDRQGFDEWLVTSGRHFAPRFRTVPPHPVPPGTYLADFLTDRAVEFIERNRPRRFLLFLAHYAVHIPLEAPSHVVRKYEQKQKPPQGVNNPVYAAMVEEVDRSVGRILATLQRYGLGDRTLVIFTSDNGGLHRRFDGQGPVVSSLEPLRGEKGTLYEGGIRVPLIVRWPGVARAGTICREPVSSIDLLPTIADAVGVAVERSWRVDGISLLPLLRGKPTLEREALFWHYPHYHHSTPASAVRSGPWKLIHFYEDGRDELYNLADDLSERHNLAGQEPERVAALRKLLQLWRTEVGARLPAPNPDYDPARAHLWRPRRAAVRSRTAPQRRP